jgi:hypothetical protein
MNDLLNLAVEAHGGLKRWSRVEAVTVAASITGEIWQTKSKPDYLKLTPCFTWHAQESKLFGTGGEKCPEKSTMIAQGRVQMRLLAGGVVSDKSFSCWLELQRWPVLGSSPRSHLDTRLKSPLRSS